MSDIYYTLAHPVPFKVYQMPPELEAELREWCKNRSTVDRSVEVPEWETVDAPESWYLGLNDKQRAFYNDGDAGGYGDDRSSAIYGISLSLLKRYDPTTVLAILMHSGYCVDAAEEHRGAGRGDPELWLWRYCVLPAKQSMEERQAARAKTLAMLLPVKRETPSFLKLNGQHCSLESMGLVKPVKDLKPISELEVLITPDALQARIARLPPHDVEAARAEIPYLLEMDPLWQESLIAQLKDVSGLTVSAIRSEMKRMGTILKGERARLEGERSPLSLRERFAYIIGLDRVYDRRARQLLKREAFRASFNVGEQDRYKEAFEDGGIERFDSLTYWPGAGEGGGEVWHGGRRCLNTWFPTELTPHEEWDAEPWLQLLRDVAQFEPAEVEHFLDYMAFLLQHPHLKVNHAIVMGGMPGVGKDTILEPIRRAVGLGNTGDIPADLLLTGFSDWLAGKKLLIVQEAQVGGRREARDIENQLKPLCAAPPKDISIHPKGLAPYHAPNVVQLVLTTNDSVPLYVSEHDRRYFMMWARRSFSEAERTSEPWVRYWRGIHQWVDGGGDRAVMGYLLRRDLSHFKPGAPPPRTCWHSDVREDSKSELSTLLRGMIERREGQLARDVVTTEMVEQAFLGYDTKRLFGGMGARRALGMALTELGLPQLRLNLGGEWGTVRSRILRNPIQWETAGAADVRRELERQL